MAAGPIGGGAGRRYELRPKAGSGGVRCGNIWVAEAGPGGCGHKLVVEAGSSRRCVQNRPLGSGSVPLN